MQQIINETVKFGISLDDSAASLTQGTTGAAVEFNWGRAEI